MNSELILVVDEDPHIRTLLKDNLEFDGYRVRAATTGREALDLFESRRTGLIVLEPRLPDMDGLRVCRSVRERSDVPIIMVSSRCAVSDKVLGLETGADDYMGKPFEYLELEARIKARLRRRFPIPPPAERNAVGSIRIDRKRHEVFKAGKRIDVTNREFDLLSLFVRNAGEALSRSAIFARLWLDGKVYRGSRVIDVHVRHLRAKFEVDPAEPRLIVTVPGVGYMLVGDDD